MNRKALFLVSLSLMLLVPALLSAQTESRRMRCGGEMSCLDLNPVQHLKMEKLRLEHQLANIDLKAERMELGLKIKEELLKEEPNRKNIEKLAKSMAAIGEKMHMNRMDHMLAVKKVLSPEQWKHFVENHPAGMRGHRNAMGRGCCDDRGAMRKKTMRCTGNPGRMGECPKREMIETDE